MPPTEHGPTGSSRKLGILGVVAVIGVLLVVVTGIRAREDASVKLREWTDDQAIPTVAVMLPDPKVLSPSLDLPGRLEAYYRAPIFARVNGYLKSWRADIGARVTAGEVIAEIEAPDLDQQLLQARADLTNQQASAKLSEVTLARRRTLIASHTPAHRLARAASASCDSASERNVASVSSRPCQRRAARSSFSGFCSARRSR